MRDRHFDLGDGLWAHPATRSHAHALVELIQRNVEHLGRYLPPIAEIISMEKAAVYFDELEKHVECGELITWHLFQDDVLCGEIRLNHIEQQHNKAAVGYFLDARFRGRGIVARALAQIIAYAFDDLAFNRIELRCVTTNAPSRRIAERAGFLLEGRLRQVEKLGDSFQDDYVFGLLAAEYATRRLEQKRAVPVEA